MSTITYHYTYIIVNKNTQMKYIGVRSCSCLPENDSDYMGSSKILIEELQKNPEAFTKTIIDTFPTREIANANEQWLHETYDVARNSEFYNQMNAPSKFCMSGRTHSEETRKKISLSNSGENCSTATRAKMSAAGKRKTFSSEHRAKISAAQKGKTPSVETRKKLSENHVGMKGKKHSEESKKKMSKIQKGRIHSPETKKKIGESKKGKLRERITCPYCNKTGGNNNMKRWHFENCREIT